MEYKVSMLKATKLYKTSVISLGTGNFDAIILHKQLKLITPVITANRKLKGPDQTTTQRCNELLFHFINIQPAING